MHQKRKGRLMNSGRLAPSEVRRMTWSRKLPKPLYLNDGRTLATLAQARDAVLALPQLCQTDPHWQHAAELLLGDATFARFGGGGLDLVAPMSRVSSVVT
jgi:hypothetical protein